MTPLILFISLGLVIPVLALAQDFDLKQLTEVYEESKTELMKPVTEFQALYADNLTKLLAEATAAGDLEQVLAVKAELEGFRGGETAEAADGHARLKQLQTIYRQAMPQRLAGANQALGPLTASYRAKLEELQVALTRQEKITEALAVKAVLDALAERENELATVANAPGAALNPAPLATGKSQGLTFTQGSLHFQLGNHGPEFDFSAAEGIRDFIDVSGSVGTWVALRQDGTAVGWNAANKAAFSRSGIAKLLYRSGGPGSAMFAITADGRIMELVSGRIELDPAPKRVVDAAVLEYHAIALFDDATIHTWGADYARDPEDKNYMPPPPAAARGAISRIAAMRYGSLVVDRSGGIHVWGRENWVPPSTPRELRNVTAVWGRPFHWVVEVRGREHHLVERKDGLLRSVRQLPAGISMVRCGEYGALGLVKGRWVGLENERDIDTLDLSEAVKALDATTLPFLWMNPDGPTPRGYLLWLAAAR